MRAFFFGLGYSARETAQALIRLDVEPLALAGTSRGEPAQALAGCRIHFFDGERPGPTLEDHLLTATHIVSSIPPGEAGDPVLRHYRAVLQQAEALEWIGYFSTVGVYGDAGAAWIDETAPCRPPNPRSKARLAAEQAWRELAAARGTSLAVLRLAGIYGPGRSALDKLRAGTARRIIKPGQVFNRIHVGDIGRLTALAARARLAGTYNVADDAPSPPQDVVAYAARLMGVPPPPEVPFEAAEMTPMARSFYADNKRVSNAAIKRALGVELLYPDYRAGLAAIAAEEAS
jgi:nucleoside-diphosphate-sugar epimerase